ncbi:peroxiredoxin family protein [Bacillus solitudinis]|uniref:peroxiredoxin family protein n=1 Tax=Bacillus solitudinis TaxID=2014074 RepID=UPI001D0CEB86|nr:redoxin domain-containing protein [Bacillus solitudinis]
MCQQQLVQLQEHLALFDDLDVDVYAISKELPEDHKELSEHFGFTYTFLSDPELEVIEYVKMRNDALSFRGYSILDKSGQYLHHEVNDSWGVEIEKTSANIHEKLSE